MAKQVRVLLVDDDPRNIRILEEILEDNYDLSVANNGREALSECNTFLPDIILLDIMMPDIDGLSVCRKLRSNIQHKHLKVILVSGKATVEERLEGYEAGADDYITKPFDDDELLAKVEIFSRLKHAEELDEIKTNFLVSISTQIGSPLNAVMSLTDLILESDNATTEQMRLLANIQESCNNMVEKLGNFLLLKDLGNDGVNRDMSKVYISDIIEEIIDREKPNSKKRNITISNYIDDNCSVVADYNLLHKAILTITSNAIDHADNWVNVTKTIDKDYLELQISDDGPGFQLSDSIEAGKDHSLNDLLPETADYKTINLFTSSNIVEMFGGTVSVNTNTPELGTIFKIRMPLCA